MNRPTSLFDRLLGQKQPAWITLVISLLLLLLPFAAAYFDGALSEFLRQGLWRIFLLPPTIVIYIWLVSPPMARNGADVIRAIRPLVPLDDANFERLFIESSRINPTYEWVAFGLGVLLGIASALATRFEQGFSWLQIYFIISIGIMYGLLIWTIYASVAGTRLNAALHRQPLRIDIFDLAPFEAIGRQGLLLALVFVGGITLSLVLTFQLKNIYEPVYWLGYLFLVVVTVLIFFLSMQPTHRLLAAVKKRELERVQQHIQHASRELVQRLDQNQEPGSLPAEINALVVFEQRLQAARTWPYDTPMLRTLFFSVLIPLGSALGRLVMDYLFP